MNPSSIWTRRDTLKALLAGGASLMSAGIARAAPSLRRRIPSSGMELPIIGLGTYSTFDVGSDASERAAVREVLRLFVEHGGAVVDSSPMYGNAESVTGDMTAELTVRDRLFLATKVWTRGESAGVEQMQTSFKRLRTTHIDLMQVHNLLDWRTHLRTLRAWKDDGRIRYIGVTHYTASAYPEVEQVLRSERLDFVQINYSLAERGAEQRLLPLAQDRGVAVLVNRPFAQASLFGKVRGRELPAWAAEFDCSSWAQFFLKYV
ncbi:MAG: aldo/keto reductase, partial [Gammaproteobacteria bacterium]